MKVEMIVLLVAVGGAQLLALASVIALGIAACRGRRVIRGDQVVAPPPPDSEVLRPADPPAPYDAPGPPGPMDEEAARVWNAMMQHKIAQEEDPFYGQGPAQRANDPTKRYVEG